MQEGLARCQHLKQVDIRCELLPSLVMLRTLDFGPLKYFKYTNKVQPRLLLNNVSKLEYLGLFCESLQSLEITNGFPMTVQIELQCPALKYVKLTNCNNILFWIEQFTKLPNVQIIREDSTNV